MSPLPPAPTTATTIPPKTIASKLKVSHKHGNTPTHNITLSIQLHHHNLLHLLTSALSPPVFPGSTHLLTTSLSVLMIFGFLSSFCPVLTTLPLLEPVLSTLHLNSQQVLSLLLSGLISDRCLISTSWGSDTAHTADPSPPGGEIHNERHTVISAVM